MELLSPAGNYEKLTYAYEYGADAAYIGLKKYSLRIKADNFYEKEYEQIRELKAKYPGKRLHCALNISFHNKDLDNFINDIDYFRQYPIDAFIVQDLGIVPILQKYFPDTELHLSTQASCINREAVKMYRNIGFKRVVLGREASLEEVRQIKDAVPDMELECFAHGAMCIAYAGRCLMSAYLTGRSANGGFCSHTCRWNYQLGTAGELSAEDAKALAQSGKLLLTEKERPGEFFPVFEGDDYTAILSSKDLCMIDHLADMKAAGVDSLKIEGRMKSLYYVAMTTRAYRKALDALDGKITQQEAQPFVDELYKAAHREFATGFFYDRAEADKTTAGESFSEYELAATVDERLSEEEEQAVFDLGEKTVADFNARLESMHPDAKAAKEKDNAEHPYKVPHAPDRASGGHLYRIHPVNRIDAGADVEFVGPECLGIKDGNFIFVDPENGTVKNWTSHNHDYLLYTSAPLTSRMIMRTKTADEPCATHP